MGTRDTHNLRSIFYGKWREKDMWRYASEIEGRLYKSDNGIEHNLRCNPKLLEKDRELRIQKKLLEKRQKAPFPLLGKTSQEESQKR